MTTRLLFVCLGNICRSPSAENIMNYLVEQQGLTQQVSCDSAGTSSYHIGSSPDSRMAAAAKKRGVKLVGQARQFIVEDFDQFDLILAMDDSNYRNILALDRSGQYGHKVKRMCDFCQEYPDRDVPDPYYGGADGFDYVISLLMDACNGLLQELDV
ncbi:low molecular weight phosphotyrosine protein phosphatase [Leptolyngbya cf. ectocarpi LEGE 11479]|uniref:protein-tyrosine-phosphatase n=1 Tax=Leptolyngbya cf. ectocarpi LEGE 11479 TaxID=1828722 RepID=A0A928X3K7_LEPEC|nr:low molecular weight protein-tyrosine-phosphatase [Leptolyngbya ectocarpi]MBE9066964.1 low molecular weight phosphotyrosine protein phosphatase [Leptolyngbya cf. ectocarpi LEGE 11479]